MKFSAEGLLPAIVAGLLSGLVILFGAVSQAALVYSGPLEGGLSMGIGAALFAAAIIAGALALGSSLRGMVGFPQGVPIAMLALMASAIATSMGRATGAEMAVTVVAAVGLATALGGLAFWLLGHFRLGGLIRFIPFPVIAAFLAGSGWLLAHGSIELLLGENMAAAGYVHVMLKLGLVLAFVALISFFSQRTHASFALSLTVLAATVLFQIGVYFSGLDADALTRLGWLIPLPDSTSLWPPMGQAGFELIDWRAIGEQWMIILTLPALSALALLMNAGGLELALRRDIDLDRELRVAGAANVIGGLGGGNMGYQDLGLTILSQRIGGNSRIIGIVAALFCLAVLTFGAPALAIVPKPLFGALLLWIGANLLLDWAVMTQTQLKQNDYIVLLVILGAIIAFGPLIGIGLGLLVSLVMFALDYARVDIVRARLDGTCFRSSVERSAAARGLLAKKGKQILVYRLQGFVFFGTAVQLRDEIEQRIRSASKGAIRHVLLDFTGVSGFDSSTMMTLIRFERLAFAHDFTLVLTGLKDDALDMLTRGGLTYGEGEPCHILPDLDRGMEWCEDNLLAKGPKGDKAAELMKELHAFFGEPTHAKEFAKHLERVDFAAGKVLVKRNSKADEIYFFESGHARAQAEPDDASTTRLRGFGPGSILGELAFFTGQRRSATVVATQDVRAWRLTRTALENMETTHEPLAAAFYRALSAQFADRLSGTNRMLRFLVD